ncbi:hypothetical protein [Acrocarpospora corrugata]|uniref:hypothetical protein n=1 Tax=Acrocarpospora corrugata TaxID=35763 RepID=UPI0012D2E082|nr:hypothetical protein [Acrocarpospora corrugata]
MHALLMCAATSRPRSKCRPHSAHPGASGQRLPFEPILFPAHRAGDLTLQFPDEGHDAADIAVAVGCGQGSPRSRGDSVVSSIWASWMRVSAAIPSAM